jgi:hypothetical protein
LEIASYSDPFSEILSGFRRSATPKVSADVGSKSKTMHVTEKVDPHLDGARVTAKPECELKADGTSGICHHFVITFSYKTPKPPSLRKKS